MYIRRLHIQHMKRIADLALEFEHEGKPRMWTVLIGENGTAKTTILQAIALAAAGSRQVNSLARPIVKHLRDRRSEAELVVDAEFAFTPQSLENPEFHPHALEKGERGLWSSFRLNNGSTNVRAEAAYTYDGDADRQQVDPLDEARGAHTPLWFVAGYGIARNLSDSTATPTLDLPSIERMRPLFQPLAALASTSFANHFLQKDDIEGRKRGYTSRIYGQMLNQALKLGGDALLPGITKLELRGQGGTKDAESLIDSDRFHQRVGSTVQRVAGVSLSHGYQSTFAWIADLIGHVLLEAKAKLSTTEMEGLVLIDEIDLYLHPAWQATFVTALRRVFPKMQFVASTHSPVVLADLAPHEIVRLVTAPDTGNVMHGGWDPKTGDVVPVERPDRHQPDPRPMTGSEVYRTWFGLDRLTPNPMGEDLRRYRVLAGDPVPSAADRRERTRLRERLMKFGIADPDEPGTGE